MDDLMHFVGGEKFTISIILIIIIASVFTYKFKKEKDLITMIWIFGTFSWIISWLYFFDKDNIDWSIPLLISWLQTAFYTSICWLWATIVLWFLEKKENNKNETDFLKEIKDEIIQSNKQNNESNQLIITELDKLNKWIWGDWDNSLINQIKLLKSDWNENHRALKQSFDAFAEKMSDNNIDALTEAIEKVMWEFNTIINEKLSKTFDDFKESVENLNIWQQNYKENIITTNDSLILSKESLEKSSQGYEIIVEKSEKFAWVSNQLWTELESLNSSLEIFKNWINEFDWVAQNTKVMADSMIKSIDSLTENFVSKAEKMVWESEKQIITMRETFAEQSKDLKASHKQILENLSEELHNSSKHTSEQFISIQAKLEEQVLEFDKKLWEELEKSINSLWKQLTGLSGKFVSDYWNLAEKLEKLVYLSNK